MTAINGPSRTPGPAAMPLSTATRMLRLGLNVPRRPVDDLIDRLAQPDGAAWLTLALEAGPLRDLGLAEDMLVRGSATIAQLRVIKERSKALLTGTGTDRLVGLAGYFMTLAAGLGHHGSIIGGRGRDELDPILLDLAAVAPAPFSEMLSGATLVDDGAEARG